MVLLSILGLKGVGVDVGVGISVSVGACVRKLIGLLKDWVVSGAKRTVAEVLMVVAVEDRELALVERTVGEVFAVIKVED